MMQVEEHQPISAVPTPTPTPASTSPTPNPPTTTTVESTMMQLANPALAEGSSGHTTAEMQRLMTWMPQMVQSLEQSRQQFVTWHDTMAKMLAAPQDVEVANMSSSA
jgi:hypothetical protein